MSVWKKQVGGNHYKKYKIQPHEWGLIVIFQNYLKNIELDWDTAGIQEVLEFEIQGKFDDRDKVICKLHGLRQQEKRYGTDCFICMSVVVLFVFSLARLICK